MASLTDKLFGQSLMLFASLLLIYYTLWVIILPLIESSHYVHQYFLPRLYALIIPIILGLFALVFVGIFVCCVLCLEGTKEKDKFKKTS